jgi:hypothetical protein
MTTKILFFITEWLLQLLKNRGVNISKLTPKSESEKQFDIHSKFLIDLQGRISIKRADIIDNQRDLIAMVEPTLFSVLSNGEDNWQKNTTTKLWFNKLNKINELINEHQTLLNEFEGVYTKIENLKK